VDKKIVVALGPVDHAVVQPILGEHAVLVSDPSPDDIAVAVGAIATGSFAMGALTVGMVTAGLVRVGRLKVRRADIRDLRVGRLEIGELVRPAAAGSGPQGVVW
jgi:hypothetical protein